MDIDRLIKRKQHAKQSGNLQRMATLVKDLGDTYFATGRLEDAMQEYFEQLQICSSLGDKLNGAVAHRMIGEVYTNLGDYKQALSHQEQYLEQAIEVGNLLEQQRAHATLGRTYFCQAESLQRQSEAHEEALRSARKAYSKSIQLCDKLKDKNVEAKELVTMRARLLLNLGLVHELQDDYNGAIELIEKAVDLCEHEKLWEDLQKTQYALGEIRDKQGKYELALEHYERATKVKDATLRAEARLAMASVYLKIGEWSKARKILVSLYLNSDLPENVRRQVEKSLRIVATLDACSRSLTTEHSTRGRLELYEKLGDAAVAAGCLTKTVEYYKEMLSCAEETNDERTAAALESLARTLKDAERPAEALLFAQREFALCTDPRELSRCALLLAELLIANGASKEEVLKNFDVAAENASKLFDAALQKSVLNERSLYLKKIGRAEEAEVIEEEIRQLREIADVESESDESEDEEIGADIRLDELSDVEREKRGNSNFVVRADARRATSFRRMRGGIKRNEKGETKLHIACINGDVDSVERLLESGHSTNVRDYCGWTPLHEAANHGHDEVVKILLQHGADVNHPGGSLCNGITPLHDAASCGNISTIQLLMDHGANSTLLTTDGRSVLDFLEEWEDRLNCDIPNRREYEAVHERLARALPSSSSKRTRISRELSSTDSKKGRSRIFIVSDDEDKEDNVESISAREYYKRAIDSLKHRYDPIRRPPKETSEFAPLVDSEQVLVDDWLEDDLGMISRFDGSSKSVSKIKSAEVQVSCEHKRSKRSSNHGPSLDDDCNSRNGQTVSVTEERRERNTSGATTPATVSVSATEKCCELNTSEERSLAIESACPKRKRHIPSIIKLNISVAGKVFKVELETTNNMEDLVSSITASIEEKFERESGCKGKFTLTKTSLAALASDNTNGDSEMNLKYEILKLEIPPIVQRYASICRAHDTEVRDFISKRLKCCENTYTFRLKSDEMDEEELVCLFKALEYQKDVQTLDFSGADFYVIRSGLNLYMSKLSLLQELHLQSCDVDLNGLSKLEAFPRQLKLLDLSYNPLDSESQEVLWRLIAPLKLLHTLNIRYCGLCDFQSSALNNEILHLDVSWNNFSVDVACRIFQRQLLTLKLSNALSSNRFNSLFVDREKACFISLDSLELASCNLLDTDVEMISSCMLNLSKLVLANNRKLTVTSSEILLRRTPMLRHIDVSGCTIIVNRPNNDVFIEHPENCTFLATMVPEISGFWIKLWRGKGTVHKLPQNLAIFKPFQ